jgi:hypothetical protein
VKKKRSVVSGQWPCVDELAGLGSFRNQYRNVVNYGISATAPGAGQPLIAEVQVAVAGRARQAAQRGSVELGLADG